MKCTNCGRELPDENRVFCGHCGHKLKSDPPTVDQAQKVLDLKKDLSTQVKPKSFWRKKRVWVILIGLFLLFLCVMAVLVYMYFFVPGLYITL